MSAMERKFSALRRPRRKLCYVTEKESAPKQWGGVLTLEDVDKMFDDIDPCTPDSHPPLRLLQSSDSEANQSETRISSAPLDEHSTEKLQEAQNGPDADAPQPASQSPSPKLDNDMGIPFKVHRPVKTSSPIEPNTGAVCANVQDNEKNETVSPILFKCEDEVAEEPNTAPVPTKKPCSNGKITVGSHGSQLEFPRCIVVLTKLSSLKEASEAVHRHENTKPPVAEVSQEPELSASRKNLEAAQRQPAAGTSSCVGKDRTPFLEKLKQAVQSKPICTRKSPVKVPPPPPPPEPEDDFLILEDDASFKFSIPVKSNTSKRRRLSKTSSTDKESSLDKKTKNKPPESPQERQELEKINSKEGDQAISPKIKKKEKEKNHDVMTSGDVEHDLLSPLDPPPGDLSDEQNLNKKKQRKNVSSKEKNQVKNQPKYIPDEVTEKEKLLRKTEPKTRKTPTKRKTSKEKKKSTKTTKVNALKKTTEQVQEPDAVNEVTRGDTVREQSQDQRSKESPETEDLDSFTVKKAPEADRKTKRKQHPAVPRGSSSEDIQVLGKRKRKQTGSWWLSSSFSAEEPEIQQPTVKKKKRKSKKANSTAELSPAKAKKDKVYKKQSQEQPVTVSTEPKTKKKKTKQTRKRDARGAVADEIKATDEIFHTSQAEQEQQISDENLDQEQSSPLVFTHRNHSVNSGSELFQRVYHHSSSEKVSPTSATPVSPRQPTEQLRETEEGKRRRKSPGNWWETSVGNDLGSSSPQLKRKGPKPEQPRKQSKKTRSTAGPCNPKTGNVASKSAGGAQTLPQRLLSAPKTVKRPLETFENIFTSTPTVVSNRGTHQSKGCDVTSEPAEEGSSKTYRKTDSSVFGEDDDRRRSTQHNIDIPQDGECRSENTLKLFKSGPSSLIELEQHEDNDGMILPSSRVSGVLSASDLCAPPLIPMTLHPKDKTNLTEWFQSLWSTTSDDGVTISPDQFDWYSYQDRALGFQLDLNRGSICSGKILLGSYMKKPLWVDHSATTVFSLLTSSVSVTIDGCVSRYRPGQDFMVECARAYSIQNTNAQPAVLHFTRILTENSD